MSAAKISVAKKAMDYIQKKLSDSTILGIGTGSTVNFFIEELAAYKNHFRGAVSSSKASTKLLEDKNIEVYSLNDVNEIEFYIDGADESDHNLNLIKGGGGALTREKIVAAVANQFVCIADDSKLVNSLGKFPLPIEVIPMSANYVKHEIINSIGGKPVLREELTTDNGNLILDIHGLEIDNPKNLENRLNNIVGVVTNGLFANRGADILLLGSQNGVNIIKS